MNDEQLIATLTTQRDMLVKALENAREYILWHVEDDKDCAPVLDAIDTALSQTKEGGA